jgi:hypothetical protein
MTFTIEHVFKESIITVLDDGGQLEDVEVLLDEDSVFIRQFNNELDRYELIELTHQQLSELTTALGLPEGTYVAR